MTDGSEAPGRDFKRLAGLRWFGAEFLVVVSGILMALALQAAYQSQEDAAAERVYLTQLDADLQETERTLQQALDQDKENETENANLLEALYGRDRSSLHRRGFGFEGQWARTPIADLFSEP